MDHSVYLSLAENLPDDFPSSFIIDKALQIMLLTIFEGSKKKYELSISVVTDEEIRILNRDYRKKDSATDVLSFPMIADDEFPVPPDSVMLGDIVISYETCVVQAENIGHSVQDEFFRLLAHGFLHLLGYDHEISQEEEILMKKKEDELLEILENSGI